MIFIAIYLMFAYFLVIKVFYKKITKTALVRLFGIMIILIYSIASYTYIMISTSYHGNFFDKITDFILLIISIRSLRLYWTRIAKVVLGSITILIILMYYILFFALLGFVMFPENDKFDNNKSYVSISYSIYNTYALFSTTSFPDAMLPYYRKRSFLSLYFLVFLWIGLYLIFNLLLATFYRNF